MVKPEVVAYLQANLKGFCYPRNGLSVRAWNLGHAIVHFRVDRLNSDLDVVEAGIPKRLGQLRQRRAVGDQPGDKLVRLLHKPDDVLSKRGFAAGEDDLRYAEPPDELVPTGPTR